MPTPVLVVEMTGFTSRPIFRDSIFVSPTDNLLTPVSQKLNAAKKKRFTTYLDLFEIRHSSLLNLNS